MRTLGVLARFYPVLGVAAIRLVPWTMLCYEISSIDTALSCSLFAKAP